LQISRRGEEKWRRRTGDEGLGFHRGNRQDHEKIRRRGRGDVDRELTLLSCLLWEENKPRTGWR
jgi:hypothetical protein